jgi:hypothetical protein
MAFRSGETLVFDTDATGNRRVIVVPDTLIDVVQPNQPAGIIDRARSALEKYPDQVTVMEAVTLDQLSTAVDYVVLLFHSSWLSSNPLVPAPKPLPKRKPPKGKGRKGKRGEEKREKRARSAKGKKGKGGGGKRRR